MNTEAIIVHIAHISLIISSGAWESEWVKKKTKTRVLCSNCSHECSSSALIHSLDTRAGTRVEWFASGWSCHGWQAKTQSDINTFDYESSVPRFLVSLHSFELYARGMHQQSPRRRWRRRRQVHLSTLRLNGRIRWQLLRGSIVGLAVNSTYV